MHDSKLWVDYAKGIGIILVVYAHVVRGVVNANIKINATFYQMQDGIIYSFHMPLFFFLSGLFFFHSLSKRGPRGLMLSKLDTIVYAYVVWSTLQGLVEVMLANYTNGNVTLKEVFSLLWNPRAQFWFLYALFVSFTVAAIFLRSRSRLYIFAIFIFSAVLFIYRGSIPYIFPLVFIPRHFVFFMFGILFNLMIKPELMANKWFLPLTALLFLMIQYISFFQSPIIYLESDLMQLFVALVSIQFIAALSNRLSLRDVNWLKKIGEASLAIYVMHTLTASGTRIILQKFLDVENAYIHVFFGVLSGIIVPLITSRFSVLFSFPVSRYVKLNRLQRSKKVLE